MAKTNMLHTIAHVKDASRKAADDKGIISAVVGSTAVLDRAGDVIAQDGWDLKNFKKNPVILWGHNVRQDRPPIGKAIKVWLDGKARGAKLMFDVQFDLQDTFAAEIYRKIKDGFVNTVSVGFIPLEREDNVFTKNELLELSFVPIPANPEALVTLRSAGLDPVEDESKLFKSVSDKAVNALLAKAESDEEDEEEKETDEEVIEDEKVETTDEEVETKEDEETETEDDSEDDAETDEEDAEETEDEVESDDTEDADESDTESDDEGEADEDADNEDDEDDTDKSVDEEETKDDVEAESKGAIAYHKYGVAPESEDWDGPGELAKCETPADLKRICAWYDHENPENKGSYKLPHHKADGEHQAVWRGVAAAMAALLGAKGGASLPEADRKAVYNHLAKHYKEFGKEAPEFKMVEEQVLAGLDEEIHALILEREDKHVVRLIKQLLKETKKVKRTVKVKQTTKVGEVSETKQAEGATMEEAIEALKVIDKALTLSIKSRVGKE